MERLNLLLILQPLIQTSAAGIREASSKTSLLVVLDDNTSKAKVSICQAI